MSDENLRLWEEGAVPTPEQWSNWFVMLPNGRKLKVAEAVLRNMADAQSCFLGDHVGSLEWKATQIRLGRWLLAEKEWEFTLRLQQLSDQLKKAAPGDPN